jgi:hypothetical protein
MSRVQNTQARILGGGKCTTVLVASATLHLVALYVVGIRVEQQG